MCPIDYVWSDIYTIRTQHLHLIMTLQAGGTIDARRLECLEELAGYDLIVNCTGIRGAQQLFNDTTMYPIRGQVGPVSSRSGSFLTPHLGV